MNLDYLTSVKKQFAYYKQLGDKTFDQISDENIFWQYNPESNSIAIIVKHLWGNMMSRWTEIFTTDGEKETRNRDTEFENDLKSKAEVLEKWNKGWEQLFQTLNKLTEADLNRIIYIRNEGHTVLEAINRQLAHYPYHVGQIVFIGKMVQNQDWKSLSIPRNKSKDYNNDKFSQEKKRAHFTDDLLNK
ncbi:DUF1572 domain-containing protein [Myroides guanonis]|uniref:DUF1572 domain-containing protein n=1 Tax=Myroides guanonis TaxID=1150112 RepID=A0A1I3PBT0_9FLAO|nr:DUF1572 domain-containing protein [Myroides guanonis]SFJ18871.1 Protein of unknown function [Myroides guanonis]